MDAEIPGVGPGTESADRPVWGKADPVFIKRKSQGGSKRKGSRPRLIPSALRVLPEKPSLIPEAGCGRSPLKET